MFLTGIRIAGAAVIAVAAMIAFPTGAAAQADCPECDEYQLDIPEPKPEPTPEPAPVVEPTVVPEAVAPVEAVKPEPKKKKKKKPKPEPPFINPYDGLGLSQPLAFQRGDAVSALSRTGFVIPMGIALLVMSGLLIRSRRQLRAANADSPTPATSTGRGEESRPQ